MSRRRAWAWARGAEPPSASSTSTCRGCVLAPSSESDELLVKKLLDPGRSAGWMNIVSGGGGV